MDTSHAWSDMRNRQKPRSHTNLTLPYSSPCLAAPLSAPVAERSRRPVAFAASLLPPHLVEATRANAKRWKWKMGVTYASAFTGDEGARLLKARLLPSEIRSNYWYITLCAYTSYTNLANIANHGQCIS